MFSLICTRFEIFKKWVLLEKPSYFSMTHIYTLKLRKILIYIYILKATHNVYSLRQSQVRSGNLGGFQLSLWSEHTLFHVASCCVYLHCFSPPKWCSVYLPADILCPNRATSYEPSQEFLLLPEMFLTSSLEFQWLSLWIFKHYNVIEMIYAENTDF